MLAADRVGNIHVVVVRVRPDDWLLIQMVKVTKV
jgi:hypothetical protein